MSDESPVFERAADELEQLSRMTRLEARGTLRLALKGAGLLPKTVNVKAMLVVLERILPSLLIRRGVQQGPEICKSIASVVRALTSETSFDVDTPEKVFARIGRSSRSSATDTKPPSSRPPPPSSKGSANMPPMPPSGKTPSGSGWSLFKSHNPKPSSE
ncbi:MAG: hypothetical protein IPM54_10000 [Polyangiaceae bacterium]|nr:hypothetical protein [Polyangiaceae bacterium]